jgi:transketolase
MSVAGNTQLDAVATTVRVLAMDAVEASSTGHPGMPMGCADLGAVLYGEILKHDPQDPEWLDRDRFVLSAGHGSMLLYALLYLSGYDISLEDIKRLRRVGSKAAGHPEYGLVPGIETTTGPLGAGFATAVGMAIAEKKLAHRFNTAEHPIIDHYTYVLSGDGCLMEGVSAEAASLAGHLKLGKLIVFYDANRVSIEGPTDITFTEDVPARFRAYGWQTLSGSAHDTAQIRRLVEEAKADAERPTLIRLESVMGRGAPTMQGGHAIHGSKLGDEEIRRAKAELGVPTDTAFYVAPEATAYFEARRRQWGAVRTEWLARFEGWKAANPQLAETLEGYLDAGRRWYDGARLPEYGPGDAASTREVGGVVLNAYAEAVENLIGGSADLSKSNKTEMPAYGDFQADNLDGRTIRFGVREHAMASICSGIELHRGFRPFCATLFLFTDYMKPAMRLAALMRLPVIYVLTHDSIYLGGDGPTHQPVEHLNALRIIPNFLVLRPGDPQEAVVAWRMAMERRDGPTALVFSRQKLTVYEKADADWREHMRRGAYVVADGGRQPVVTVVATGSEVELALEAAALVPERAVRIVSMPSRELFLRQEKAFRRSVVPDGPVVVAEAGSGCGWEALTGGRREYVFSIDRFGESGRPKEVAEHLGFTAPALAARIRAAAEGA